MNIIKLAGTMVVVNIIVAILIVACIVKGCMYVREHGLKNVAGDIWNGTNAPPAEVQTNSPIITGNVTNTPH